MPFKKGEGGRKKGTTVAKRTVWIMESLRAHGYDYEKMLVTFLTKAAQGDKIAADMAALLTKLVPYIANAPKMDVDLNGVENLVINRYKDKNDAVNECKDDVKRDE